MKLITLHTCARDIAIASFVCCQHENCQILRCRHPSSLYNIYTANLRSSKKQCFGIVHERHKQYILLATTGSFVCNGKPGKGYQWIPRWPLKLMSLLSQHGCLVWLTSVANDYVLWVVKCSCCNTFTNSASKCMLQSNGWILTTTRMCKICIAYTTVVALSVPCCTPCNKCYLLWGVDSVSTRVLLLVISVLIYLFILGGGVEGAGQALK